MSLTTSLQAAWKLDESSGNAADATGNGNTLTNHGTASYSSGLINNGVDFGSGNTTKYLDCTSLTFNSYPVSMSVWFKANTANDNGNFCGIYNTAGSPYYQLKCDSAAGHIVFRSNTATVATGVDTGIAISTGVWYHVVAVLQSSTSVDLYVNGSITNTGATVDNATGLDRFAIGALARSSPLQFYSGMVDAVEYYNRALNSTDVSQLYNGGIGRQYPFTTAYAMTPTAGSYAITGVSTSIRKVFSSLIATAGSYAITGSSIAISFIRGWSTPSRHSSSYSEQARSSDSFSNQSRSSSSWTDQSKS